MKRLILLTATLLIFIATSTHAQLGSKKVKGNGKITTETRTTGDYSGIKCKGSFDYVLVSGKEGKIILEGESNLLEYIITEVKGGTLIVKTKKRVNLKPNWKKTIKITIPFMDIDNVSLSGSGDLWTEDTIISTNFDATMAGSGDVTIDIEANSIKCRVAGSGDLTLKGTTHDLVAKLAGSGDIHAFKLEANNTTASVAGSGDVAVVSNKSLHARVTGSGDIVYRGNPSTKDTKKIGSGSISK